MLIVSLPPVHQEKLLETIVSHPLVGAVRYNTGQDSAYSPEETISRILMHTARHGKPLYIDLKGKQLRVTEWATLPYGPITLNHQIVVELPAKVYFRGDDCCDLKEVVDGNKIYVDPLPKYSVGRGQAVNIVGKGVEVKGDFTDTDRAYVSAALRRGVARFMLSFVEDAGYVLRLEDLIRACRGSKPAEHGLEIVLKIESQAGVDFVRRSRKAQVNRWRLMAARDDLMIQIGALNMLDALKTIVAKDSKAICASRLLMGLAESSGEVSMADISDLELMRRLGYRHFMLSDGVSRNHFAKAMEFWLKYTVAYPLL